MKLRLYLSQKQAELLQGYQSLCIVASHLFGKSEGTKKSEGDFGEVKTKGELEMAFKNVFGSL